jgi:hypothetical protein
MSYLKANNKIDIYSLPLIITSSSGQNFNIEDGIHILYKSVQPYKTLMPGDVFSKPIVKSFTDKNNNNWIELEGYEGSKNVPFALIKNDADATNTGDVLSQSERDAIKKDIKSEGTQKLFSADNFKNIFLYGIGGIVLVILLKSFIKKK